MTQPKTRSDSLAPVPSASFAATGRSLIPPPAQAPPDEAAAAYAQVEAELVTLTDDAVETRRVDAVAAAGKARKMADEILADARLVERFRKVAASDEFSLRSLERLATYGLALWHSAYQQGSTTPAGRRNLPEALRAKARAVRERMQKLVEYHFGVHPDEATVVANLVAMRSDRGLAQVLVGFADLYARHPAVVTTDATHYRPTDAADARTLAEEIRDALDADPGHWGARTARAWTLLVRAYNDVQATGLWMFRATPVEGARRFPSLIAESRACTTHGREDRRRGRDPGYDHGRAPGHGHHEARKTYGPQASPSHALNGSKSSRGSVSPIPASVAVAASPPGPVAGRSTRARRADPRRRSSPVGVAQA